MVGSQGFFDVYSYHVSFAYTRDLYTKDEAIALGHWPENTCSGILHT